MKNSNISPIERPANAQSQSTKASLHQAQRDIGPSKDEIAKKAYSIYQARGCPQGLDLQHWLEAETHIIGARNLSRMQN
jgi:hypothetical protein